MLKTVINLSIGKKMALLSGALICGILIVGVTGYVYEGKISSSSQKIMREHLTALSQLAIVAPSIERARLSLVQYLSAADTASKIRFRQSINENTDIANKILKEALSSNYARYGAEDMDIAYKEINDDWQAFVKTREEELIPAAESGNLARAKELATGIQQERYDRISKNVKNMADTEKKEAEEDADLIEKIIVHARLISVGTIVIILIAAVFMAMFMTKIITTPLEKLILVAEKIAEGDLTQQVDVKSEDEIGMLGNTFNRLVEKLHGMIAQIAMITQQAAAAAEQSSSSSEELASGAEEQQAQTSQVATSVEEMSATVQEVAKNAHEAAINAKNSGDVAKKGGEVVQQTIDGINRITNSSVATAEAVRILAKNSEQIGNIIGVIDDVADQTNLLALNAAIEAARAGDQGRGFAVVADEVRKLAERTSASTKEIATMVKAMQEGTSQASSAMERGLKDVEQGVMLVDQAGNILREIVGSSQRVLDLIQQVATASEEQSAAAEEISSNVEAVASVAKQTAAGTQQISSAAQEVAKLADTLQSVVNKFKLKSGAVKEVEKRDHIKHEFKAAQSGSLHKKPIIKKV